MARGKIFLIVGHSNWGKSRTLRELTNGVYQQHWVTLGEVQFFVRRMSNDDRSDEFRDFVNSLRPEDKPRVIAAFCPTFSDDRDGAELVQIMRERYDLHFFVLKHRHDGSDEIPQAEIDAMREYGLVEVFDRHAEPNERAAAFSRFVIRNG